VRVNGHLTSRARVFWPAVHGRSGLVGREWLSYQN